MYADAQLEHIKSPALHLATGLKGISSQKHQITIICQRSVKCLIVDLLIFAHSIYFQGQWSGGLTFASKEKFEEEHLDIFRAIVPALSAVVETHASKLVTSTLLETYLGADAGRRVYLGQVKRGDGQTLRSVVWFSDIRGFTK